MRAAADIDILREDSVVANLEAAEVIEMDARRDQHMIAHFQIPGHLNPGRAGN